MSLNIMNERARRMVLEGRELNLFNIDIEALRQEGKLMINYPVDGHSDEWISFMESLRDIIKRQGSEVPKEEWLPFNLYARERERNVFVVGFNFSFCLLDGGDYCFGIGVDYSPMAFKPNIIEMVEASRFFMCKEISSRC